MPFLTLNSSRILIKY